jgi:flagellar motor switch protein FliM
LLIGKNHREIADLATSNIANEILSYDFQQAGRLNDVHVQALSTLHEGLVRNLSSTLGNAVHSSFAVKLAGIEELAFSQLTGIIPPSAYVVSILFQPQHTLGGIHIDLSLLFPMLDLLLGGTGNSPIPDRGLTEIEEFLMQDVVHLICAELEKSWKVLEMTVSSGDRQKPAQLPKLMLPGEKVLVLRLAGRLSQAEGAMNIFFPAGTAAAMLRKLFKAAPAVSLRPSAPSAGQRIQERLLECPCAVDLAIPGIKVSLAELLHLEPGKLLDLGVPVTTPALFSLEGQEWFESFPVRAGSFRAARIGNRARRRSQNG